MLKLFVIAGEPSGDVLGGGLLRGLTELSEGHLRVRGVGGPCMREMGVHSIVPLADIAHIGFFEVLPMIPRVRRHLRATVDALTAFEPDLLITIDAPAFTLPVATVAKRQRIPVLHYAGPQYWAWLPWRVRGFRPKVDGLMALFPWEAEFFRNHDVPTELVGHPALSHAVPQHEVDAFRASLEIVDGTRMVIVLPGSRGHVARTMLPIFEKALERVAISHPIRAVVPVVEDTASFVSDAVRAWRMPTAVVPHLLCRTAMAAADVALTVSGTSTLELTVADVPMVVTYRLNPLTAAIARRLVRGTRYVSLPNVTLERALVPELLQGACTPRRIAEALVRLLTHPEASAAQRDGLAEVRSALSVGGEHPSMRAARCVMRFLGERGLNTGTLAQPVAP